MSLLQAIHSVISVALYLQVVFMSLFLQAIHGVISVALYLQAVFTSLLQADHGVTSFSVCDVPGFAPACSVYAVHQAIDGVMFLASCPQVYALLLMAIDGVMSLASCPQVYLYSSWRSIG